MRDSEDLAQIEADVQFERERDPFLVDKARRWREFNYQPHMERWLRMRDEQPERFEQQPIIVQDQTQVYSDLRAPYTAAVAAGLIVEEE